MQFCWKVYLFRKIKHSSSFSNSDRFLSSFFSFFILGETFFGFLASPWSSNGFFSFYKDQLLEPFQEQVVCLVVFSLSIFGT